MNGKCRLRVIFDRPSRFCLPVHVRFAPKADLRPGQRDKAEITEVDVGGGGGGPNDPLIKALIQKLPPTGPWIADERVTWLKMLAMAFQITYGQEPNIDIKKEAAN